MMFAPRKDGGPAFPREDYQANGAPEQQPLVLGQEGMSLRDWYAGKAMEALVGDPALVNLIGMEDTIAKQSFVMADAMLKARSE